MTKRDILVFKVVEMLRAQDSLQLIKDFSKP